MTKLDHINSQLKLLQQSKQDLQELIDGRTGSLCLYHLDYRKCCQEIEELLSLKFKIETDTIDRDPSLSDSYEQFCNIDRDGDPIYVKPDKLKITQNPSSTTLR